MKVILITKYFAPDQSVDAVSVGNLISSLSALDPHIDFHVVTTNHDYKNKQKKEESIFTRNAAYKVHRVNSLYCGNTNPLKLLSAITDGFRLVMRARRLKINNIISLTNPPLITFWCALLLRRRNWLYWTFDLYPDALKASHIISGEGILYKFLESVVYSAPPSFLISLGRKQYSYLTSQYRMEVPWIFLPCGIIPADSQMNVELPDWYVAGKKYVGYLGNIGKAHSKDFVIEFIKKLPALQGYTLVLAVYGEHRESIEKFVESQDAKNIVIVHNVERKHLHLIDIHLVSLLEEWTNISVPSKAVSAVCAGSALIFYGSWHSDTWNMFEKCSFFVDTLADLTTLLAAMVPQDVEIKKSNAKEITRILNQQEKLAYSKILKSLQA